MLQPTTRYGRFVDRQARYRRRYERWRRNRRRVEKYLPLGHVRYRRSQGWDGTPGARGKQLKGFGRSHTGHGPVIVRVGWPNTIVTTASRGVPPIVRLLTSPPLRPYFGTVHPNRKWCGYSWRQCRYFGRKVRRQTARDRVIRAATYFGRRNQESGTYFGVKYPWWDPLHRTPQLVPYADYVGDWTRFESPPHY
jgi:hypothetical protein